MDVKRGETEWCSLWSSLLALGIKEMYDCRKWGRLQISYCSGLSHQGASWEEKLVWVGSEVWVRSVAWSYGSIVNWPCPDCLGNSRLVLLGSLLRACLWSLPFYRRTMKSRHEMFPRVRISATVFGWPAHLLSEGQVWHTSWITRYRSESQWWKEQSHIFCFPSCCSQTTTKGFLSWEQGTFSYVPG